MACAIVQQARQRQISKTAAVMSLFGFEGCIGVRKSGGMGAPPMQSLSVHRRGAHATIEANHHFVASMPMASAISSAMWRTLVVIPARWHIPEIFMEQP